LLNTEAKWNWSRKRFQARKNDPGAAEIFQAGLEMIEILFVLAGTVAGLITGLVPGIHLNTVSILVPLAAAKNDFNLALFVISMSVSHSFSDFIPSILLGAPSEENYLSVLPGHALLLKGKGTIAIRLAVSGALFGGILSIAIAGIYLRFAEKFFPIIRAITPWLLILSLALMVAFEKGNRKKVLGIAVILVSAALGETALNFLAFPNPLFALVTGFFGASTLIQSIRENNSIPVQSEGEEKMEAKVVWRGTGFGFIAGSVVSMIPSMGSNQAAFMVEKVFGRLNRMEYLAMLGSASVSGTVLSYFFLFVTGLPRTGSAVAVKSLGSLAESQLPAVFLAVLVAAGISFMFCRWLSGKAVKALEKINYSKASAFALAFICIMTFLLCGPIGIAVMGIGSLIGITPQILGLKRTHCMAFLAFPTILIYFGI